MTGSLTWGKWDTGDPSIYSDSVLRKCPLIRGCPLKTGFTVLIRAPSVFCLLGVLRLIYKLIEPCVINLILCVWGMNTDGVQLKEWRGCRSIPRHISNIRWRTADVYQDIWIWMFGEASFLRLRGIRSPMQHSQTDRSIYIYIYIIYLSLSLYIYISSLEWKHLPRK